MLCRFPLVLLGSLLLVAGVGRAEESDFLSGGVKIHYRVEGQGEPVLLIHGFAATVYLQWVYPGILRTLARDHRVIAMDVRGHGQSDKPTDTDKYGTEMVEDAVRLLDHLKIPKAHVVGYSMGAVITGKLLATHPDRLLSATLGGAGIVLEGGKLPPFVDPLAASLEEGKGLEPLLTYLTPPGKPKLSPTALQIANRSLVGGNSKALLAVVRSWKKLSVRKEQLRANQVPTLALIGEIDPLKEYIDHIQNDMANLKVVVIDGADHFTTCSSPKFIRTLRQFLSEQAQQRKERKKAPAAAGK